MYKRQDVYFALFNNNVINLDHLASPGAEENEKAVYEAFRQKKEKVWNWLTQELYQEDVYKRQGKRGRYCFPA